MQDGQQKDKFSVWKTLKESSSDALKVIEHTREVTGRPIQIVTGAMLAISISMLYSLLGVQHLDTALTIVVISEAISIPLLLATFVIASLEFSSNVPPFLVNIMRLTSMIFFQPIGAIGVGIALLSVIGHLVPAAAIVTVITVVFVFLAFTIMTIGIIIWLAIIVRKSGISDDDFDVEEVIRKSKLSFLLESDKPNLPEQPTNKQADSTE